jgi:hypothetical protein
VRLSPAHWLEPWFPPFALSDGSALGLVPILAAARWGYPAALGIGAGTVAIGLAIFAA